MAVQTTEKQVYSKVDIQKAISAIKNNEYRSIRKAALAFNIPNATLQGRMSGRNRVLQLMKHSKSFQPPKKRHYPDGLRV
jgi:hypothetical protein